MIISSLVYPNDISISTVFSPNFGALDLDPFTFIGNFMYIKSPYLTSKFFPYLSNPSLRLSTSATGTSALPNRFTQ
ncbi:hypothetical protein V6M85_03755 [Sulfolobus tengchongensis]|uniref:Uncharacterized protein n=1 Tax=Sulfolobus tengchongensis TaxID=207809 RepID=A0AAX4L1V3_9CREN